VDRVTPAVHPKRPQPDAVRDELTVEDIGFLAHGHRKQQRLDPGERLGGGFGHRGGLHRLEPPGFTNLRVARTQVPNHQRRCDRGMTLTPYRGADRNYLADHSFCRVGAARYDGCDIIDLDTTGHRHSVLFSGSSSGRCTARIVAGVF
jgi:hypothetical protein